MTLNNIVQRRRTVPRQSELYSLPRLMAGYGAPWQDVERIFERAFNLTPVQLNGNESQDFTPALDLHETEREFQVRLELPGMNEKDIEISLAKDMLTISGEKREEVEENARGIYRMERRFGSFSRTVRLPENVVDADKVEAAYKDGVLTIKLPKVAEVKESVKKISIGESKNTVTEKISGCQAQLEAAENN